MTKTSIAASPVLALLLLTIGAQGLSGTLLAQDFDHAPSHAIQGPPVRLQRPYAQRFPDVAQPPQALFTLPPHVTPSLPRGNGTLPPPGTASVREAPATGPLAGGDAFEYFVNRPLGVSGTLSSTAEPSAAMVGDTAFQTGNRYAAHSTDSGQTWTQFSPFGFFGTDPDSGFCCDQRTVYVPSHDLTIWVLQYKYSSTTLKNTHRIAVCRGRDRLRAASTNSNWTFVDYTPNDMGFGSRRWLDYPDLAYSNSWLFVSANVFDNSNSFQGSVVWRISLDDLRDEAATPSWWYRTSSTIGGSSYRFAQGAPADRIWFASLLDSTTVRVFLWNDSTTAVLSYDRTVSSFRYGATASATGPDGRDWAGHGVATDRVHTGFALANEIGFLWGCAQNPPARQMPYVRVARFRASDAVLIDQEDIANQSLGFLYPATCGNQFGEVGCVLAVGGGSAYPHVSAFIIDAYQGWNSITTHAMSSGTHGPATNRWGDYYSVQVHPQHPHTWIAAGAAQNGGTAGANSEPRFAWFGREERDPGTVTLTVRSTPISDVAITVQHTDRYGRSDGDTSFTRAYFPNQRYALTAPLTVSSGGVGYAFERWVKYQGSAVSYQTLGATTYYSDDIGSGDETLEARYVVRRRLTVQSSGRSAVSIAVGLADIRGMQNGTTEFTRDYRDGSVVTLTPSLSSILFRGWRIDGVLHRGNSVNVTMNAGVTAVAEYATVLGGFTELGTGCSGSNGVPHLGTAGTPMIGGRPEYHVLRGPRNGLALLALGFSDTMWNGIPLPIPVSGTSCTIQCAPSSIAPLWLDGNGAGQIDLPIPANPDLVGLELYTQVWSHDPGANAAGLTLSNRVRTLIGDG